MESCHRLKGLKGWLIPLGLWIFFTPLRLGYFIWTTYSQFLNPHILEALAAAQKQNGGTLRNLFLLTDFSVNSLMFIASIVMIFLFIVRKRQFPFLFVILSLSFVFIIILEVFTASIVYSTPLLFDKTTVIEIFVCGVSAAIWIPYIFVSKRVKHTFVR